MSLKLTPIGLTLLVAVSAAALPLTLRSGKTNPLPASPEIVASGAEHFANNCAQCHAPDGSGPSRTIQIYVPDLRSAATQSLTDEELFFILESSGARGTDQIWQLVHFVRSLPEQTRAARAGSPAERG